MPTMPTYTVTIAGAERYDGEERYTYCVAADSRENAARQALDHHFHVTTQGEDDDLIVTGILEGPPPETAQYAWHDLRTYTSITPELVRRMIETPHGLILKSKSGRFRPSAPGDLRSRHDHDEWRIAYTRDEAVTLLVSAWGTGA